MDEELKAMLTEVGLDLTMDIDLCLDALADSEGLPVVELAMCTIRFDESGPVLRTLLARAALGEFLAERDARLLFRGLHILGGARDAKAFKPLMHLLRRPIDDLDELLGDAITETLSKIVTGVFDGDLDLLLKMIADADIDQFVRDALFGAATYLTWEGRIDREDFKQFLLRFEHDNLAEPEDHAWVGWQEAIALLGFRDLQPMVHQAFQDRRIDKMALAPAHFDADLDEAERAPDDAARFKRAYLGYVEDVLESLQWTDTGEFSALDEDIVLDAGPGYLLPPDMPVTNRFRAIGRNDPCPCGSGKKFKKCCLR